MSTVNYSLNNKGVRLISAEKAWVKGKNGKYRLNPDYRFVGKLDTHMSNLVLSTVDKKISIGRRRSRSWIIFTMRTANETGKPLLTSGSRRKTKIKRGKTYEQP